MNKDAAKSAHLEWTLSRVANDEPVTMPDFAAKFEYYCEEDAHSAFEAVLSSTNITRTKRSRLKSNYDVWRRNSGAEYWASRRTMSQIRVSTKRTAEELVSGGEHIAKKWIQEYTTSENLPSPTLPASSAKASESLSPPPQLPQHHSVEPPAYLEDKDVASSQSSFQVFSSSPAPAEEYLRSSQLFMLDLAEVRGPHPDEQPVYHTLDKFWSIEERWAVSSIQVVEEHKCFPKSIRSQLPLPCRDAIDTFLVALDEGRRYYAPQATTDMELEVFTILTSLSLSHGPKCSNDCCQARNQEMNFIIHHISIIWNSIFNTHEGFSVKWDKRLDRNGLERPDIVISHNGVAVGCGEIKPFHAPKGLIDEDRARLPEFMKRILHERIVGAQSEEEFAVFGFLVSGDEVEISFMKYVDGEYLYKVHTGIVLSSTIGKTDSIAQLLARLYFVRQWITATAPIVEGPRLFYDISRLKPTLRLL